MPNFITLYFFVLLFKFGRNLDIFESVEQPALESDEEDIKKEPIMDVDLSEFSALISSNVQICSKHRPFLTEGKSISVEAISFQTLVKESRYWSDKSNLINKILNSAFKDLVITYPRKSGKSINLDMISNFVEIPHDEYGRALPLESSFAYKYFAKGIVPMEDADVKVTPAPKISNNEYLINHYLGKYPVIYLSFANIRLENTLTDFRQIISDLYSKHTYVLRKYSETIKNGKKSSEEYRASMGILGQYYQMKNPSTNRAKLLFSISFLSKLLSNYYKQKVMIFIDDYSNLINPLLISQHDNGGLNTRDLINFYYSFLKASVKQNKYSKKSVLTGILTISDSSRSSHWKEGFRFVNCMESNEFNEFYGFTPNEVNELLSYAKSSSFTPNWKKFRDYSLEEVANHYGGYATYKNAEFSKFSSLSVASFINHAKFSPSWNDPSMIASFWTLYRFPMLADAISDLLDGHEYSLTIGDIEEIDFHDLNKLRVFIQDTSINEGFSTKNLKTAMSLLLLMGYLTPVKNSLAWNQFSVRIPNREIREILISEWFDCILVPEIKKTIPHLRLPEFIKKSFISRVKSFLMFIAMYQGPDSSLQDLIIKKLYQFLGKS